MRRQLARKNARRTADASGRPRRRGSPSGTWTHTNQERNARSPRFPRSKWRFRAPAPPRRKRAREWERRLSVLPSEGRAFANSNPENFAQKKFFLVLTVHVEMPRSCRVGTDDSEVVQCDSAVVVTRSSSRDSIVES